jgi:hypothetical protein
LVVAAAVVSVRADDAPADADAGKATEEAKPEGEAPPTDETKPEEEVEEVNTHLPFALFVRGDPLFFASCVLCS